MKFPNPHLRGSDLDRDGGFTLTETLVSVTLLAIVAGGATTAIVSGTNAQDKTQNRVVAANLAGGDLDTARSVAFPKYPTAASSTVVFAGTTYSIARSVTAFKSTGLAIGTTTCPDQVTAIDVVQLVVTSKVTWNGSGPGVTMSTVIAC